MEDVQRFSGLTKAASSPKDSQQCLCTDIQHKRIRRPPDLYLQREKSGWLLIVKGLVTSQCNKSAKKDFHETLGCVRMSL